MKPAPFEYHVARSVADAVAVLGEYGDDAKALAGGQSLVPLLALRLARFPHLVDLNRVESLAGISRVDGWLEVGATTRQATVERSAEVSATVPLLARAVPLIGHFQIRNRGTIGGSIAHADPASELPAVALALGAEMVVSAPGGQRTVPASEFFVSTWTTCLGPDELLTTVRFPVWPGRHGAAIEEFSRRSGDFALTGAACAVQLDGADRISRAGIALFAMGSTPIQAGAAEAALTGSLVGDVDAEEIGRIATADTEPPSDIHAPAAYRRTVGAYMVARALSRALEEASRD